MANPTPKKNFCKVFSFHKSEKKLQLLLSFDPSQKYKKTHKNIKYSSRIFFYIVPSVLNIFMINWIKCIKPVLFIFGQQAQQQYASCHFPEILSHLSVQIKFQIAVQHSSAEEFCDVFVWGWNECQNPKFLYTKNFQGEYPEGESHLWGRWEGPFRV